MNYMALSQLHKIVFAIIFSWRSVCVPFLKMAVGCVVLCLFSLVILFALSMLFLRTGGMKESSINIRVNDAAKSGDIASPTECLKMNRDFPNSTDKPCNTALHYAPLEGHVKEVRLLVNKSGADVEVVDEYGRTPLHCACIQGHTETVSVLLSECKADVHATDNFGWKGLHLAAGAGHECVVKLLVKNYGCDIDDVGRGGYTACHCASERGQGNMLRMLVSDFNANLDARDNHGNKPLHLAALSGHQNIVRMLVNDFGCDANDRGKDGWTACHWASAIGNEGLIRLLASDFEANVKAADNNGNMALHVAAMGGHLDIIRMLVDEFNCKIDDKGHDGMTACHWTSAIASSKEKVVRTLLSELHADPRATTDSGNMPLHLAAFSGNQDIVRMLVKDFDCDVDASGRNGWTACHWASVIGRKELVKMLISELQANPRATGNNGNMPLHLAAISGHQDIVRMLVNDFNCGVDDRGMIGWTPCHWACKRDQGSIVRVLIFEVHGLPRTADKIPLYQAALCGHQDIVKMLANEFGCGIDSSSQVVCPDHHWECNRDQGRVVSVKLSPLHENPMLTGESGDQPFYLADLSRHQDIIGRLVEEFGSCGDFAEQKGMTACQWASAIAHGQENVVRTLIYELHAHPKATTNKGNMPLHLAALSGHEDIIRMLVSEFGCGVDDKGHEGQTACHFACTKGHYSTVRMLISELQADPKAITDKGDMPVHLAARYGHANIVRFLVTEARVDPQSKGSRGRTPLHHACSTGNLDIFKLLVSDMNCSHDSCDADGNTLLHVAAMNSQIEVVRQLVDDAASIECRNFQGQTPLHLATQKGDEELVRIMIDELACDPDAVDAKGDTVLHYAARAGNHLLLAYLLSHCKFPSPRNRHGHTPLSYAIHNHNIFAVSELVKHNCKPSTVDGAYVYKELEQSSSKRLSQCSLTKVFVIGNKAVGKTTLVEALKSEARQDSRFVQYVTPHTCGIVPSMHESKLYGRVLFYDFAGDPEYYSSHAASLERLLFSTCHIFLLVIDLSEEHETIIRKLGYWLTFISYNSRSTEVKSQVIIVGSHADIVSCAGEDAEEKMGYLFMEVSEELSKEMKYVEMCGYCALDCRDATSDGIQTLSSHVKVCSLGSNTQVGNISAGASVLLGVLDKHFKDRIACQVSEVRIHVEVKEICLPLELSDFYSYLEELNARGLILILGNREGLNEEWVVLDISAFLSKIHKNLLSKSFLKYVCARKALSNLGIISESDLRNLGPEYDPRLLKQCLKHLQYCIEIDDTELLYRILNITEESTKDPQNPRSKLLFFPALLPEAPQESKLTWASDEVAPVCKGWYIECLKSHEYFPPRFSHVLLLRLAFSFALPLPVMHATGKPSQQYSRRCQLWRSGVKWVMSGGCVECVVQLVRDSKGVMVMVRGCDGSNVECSSALINIVGKVLSARQDFCHSLAATMYLLDPNSMKQRIVPDIDQIALFDLSEVEKQLSVNGRVLSIDGKKPVPALEFQRNCMWDIIFPIRTKEVLDFVTPSLSWYDLGLQLDVPERILDAIKQDNPRDVTTCTRRLVQEWLTRTPRPSWYLLVIALRRLRENRTAADIAERYGGVLAVQESLLDDSISSSPVSEEFINRFSKLVAQCWPLLASLLSLSTAEIDQIKRGVTGAPSVKAAAMMNRWREKASSPTYLTLHNKLSALLEEQLMALQ